MPSSSKQAAFAASRSFSDHAEPIARSVMRLVQTLTPVAQAAAPWLISQVLGITENTARAILRIRGWRPIQNEENIAVPSPQAAAVFSNPKCCDSPVQLTRRGCDITDWERGDLIGKGSFASVYRCSNEDGSFFAAKGVSLGEHNHLPHLKNEIDILEGLDHENIIQFLGKQKHGKMLYIFLELASQGTLQKAYKNCRFKESQVSDYTRQILEGLTYLHSCNVVHGDLNSANILVTESGRVKLADFGLSKRMEDHRYGFLSDIWDLGYIVLEMSTGKLPRLHISAKKLLISEELAIRSRKRPVVVPDYLSGTLRDFINQCMQPDPNPRPTAAELLAHPFVKESSFHPDS